MNTFSKDKYNEEQKHWQQKLHDIQRQKERIEEKLLQAHVKSPSPTKPKKNTFQVLTKRNTNFNVLISET